MARYLGSGCGVQVEQMPRPPVRSARATLTMAAFLLALAGPAAAATQASWNGAAGTATWSTAGNWSTGTAPAGELGQLTLPAVGPGCGDWGCAYGVDDTGALTVGTLALDAAAGYLVRPLAPADRITLLHGLLFGSSVAASGGPLDSTFAVPLALGAGQRWNVSGVPGTPTALQLGAVTGASYPLTVALASGVTLGTPEMDTGPLTLVGAGTLQLTGTGAAQPADGVASSPPPLLSRHGTRLEDGASLELSSGGTVAGPITVAPGSPSMLAIGDGVAPDGTAVVNGSVVLRASSTLSLWIDQPAPAGLHRPRPGTDYSQLIVLGSLDLNGATLALTQGYTDSQVACAALEPGQTYTLAEATRLTGTFAGIANGQAVGLGACDPLAATTAAVVVRYNTATRPQSITATVIGDAQARALVAQALAPPPPAAASALGLLRAGGYTETFDAPAAGTLALSWATRVHGRLLTIARASNSAGQAGPRRLPIRLTLTGTRLLRFLARAAQRRRPNARVAALTVTASASFTPGAMSSPTLTPVTIHRTIRLG